MSATFSNGVAECPHCGSWHGPGCPRIKAIEYHPNGTIKRIEYHDAGGGANR